MTLVYDDVFCATISSKVGICNAPAIQPIRDVTLVSPSTWSSEPLPTIASLAPYFRRPSHV